MPDSFADSPILIWQMGKVGSTSIGDALRSINVTSTQLHVIDSERLDNIVREHNERGFAVPDHISDALRLQALIKNSSEKFRIISLVRDPIERNLSALFESWEVYPPSYSQAEGPSALAEWFVMNFDYSVLNWFDHEIINSTRINIYNTPFDHNSKKLLIETDRIKIMVLRKEDSQIQKKKNLEDFLDIPEINIGYSNISDLKNRSALWNTMRTSAKVSSILLDNVYKSRMVRHFYTDYEIEKLRMKWAPSKDGIYFEDHLYDQVEQ